MGTKANTIADIKSTTNPNNHTWDDNAWFTINSEEYYELKDKARKWDNLMKLLEVKQ